MRSRFSSILWGIIFIAVGIFYVGDTFKFWDFRLFFNGWWTLIIIIPCLISIVENGFGARNVVGLAIGILFLLSSQGIVNSRTIGKLIFPAILILIGIKIIFRDSFNKTIQKNINTSINREGRLDYTSIFSSQRETYPNEQFKGASILAICGGVELNLMNAIINEDIIIDSTSICGGVDIIVPNNVNVKISSIPIFGGAANKARPCMNANAPTIYINATCIFGSLDSK
jgi:predicted membrane protein